MCRIVPFFIILIFFAMNLSTSHASKKFDISSPEYRLKKLHKSTRSDSSELLNKKYEELTQKIGNFVGDLLDAMKEEKISKEDIENVFALLASNNPKDKEMFLSIELFFKKMTEFNQQNMNFCRITQALFIPQQFLEHDALYRLNLSPHIVEQYLKDLNEHYTEVDSSTQSWSEMSTDYFQELLVDFVNKNIPLLQKVRDTFVEYYMKKMSKLEKRNYLHLMSSGQLSNEFEKQFSLGRFDKKKFMDLTQKGFKNGFNVWDLKPHSLDIIYRYNEEFKKEFIKVFNLALTNELKNMKGLELIDFDNKTLNAWVLDCNFSYSYRFYMANKKRKLNGIKLLSLNFLTDSTKLHIERDELQNLQREFRSFLYENLIKESLGNVLANIGGVRAIVSHKIVKEELTARDLLELEDEDFLDLGIINQDDNKVSAAKKKKEFLNTAKEIKNLFKSNEKLIEFYENYVLNQYRLIE